MLATATALKQVLEDYFAQLKNLEESEVSAKPSPTRWSKKETLGHLIDSAQNNLRRFIVAQYEDSPKITYQQDEWVRNNHYQEQAFDDLLQLWYLTNRQLVAVLNAMDKQTAERTCDVGSLHSLDWLAADYTKHLKHHLHQILDLETIPYP